jgi:hypothetical protein
MTRGATSVSGRHRLVQLRMSVLHRVDPHACRVCASMDCLTKIRKRHGKRLSIYLNQ